MKNARIIDQVKASKLAIKLRKAAGLSQNDVAKATNGKLSAAMVAYLEGNAFEGNKCRNWTAKHFETYVAAVKNFRKEKV